MSLPFQPYAICKDFGPLVVAGVTAYFGLRTYHRNERTYKAELMLKLHNSFFVDEKAKYRHTREMLDSDRPNASESRSALVEQEPEDFTDFLNFFEMVAYLQKQKLLSSGDINSLFGYYLQLLADRTEIRNYIHDAGKSFEDLGKLLDTRDR